ncbi:MAG: SPOR domain-containing protein [Gammaproteobacteria bacterium]|nr:SPOR domain-containing protein [Gammaproteobacteria bacterium]MBU1554150.1 SPOR domain-containing protein [Gammaproteobacteria bacterium]MBU2072330.1 SPOR domain-containing protein [Gammaproteobacteria bacterium]MBU2183862.1 SPOR domain-containing protein [Gammaproteobacteria bacterium]MBU2206688.1 SPOR domain-containing protein [Gammaproteobacteria bacterium]
MTAAFKHRLLGTAILVMAGIIFLPDLLDGEKQVVKDDFKVIPDRPEFKGVQQQQVIDGTKLTELQQQLQPAAVDEQPLDLPAAELPPQQVVQVTVESEAVKSQANPALAQAGWVVRVGSFSKVQNANALVAKLRQAGFVTFTRNITNTQGLQLTSVLVGPELRKEKLEQQLAKLQQLTGLERLTVMSYQPAENN